MNRAKFIICYAGYTTMMEFCELDVKKALIIPSPNGPEQNYLAEYYSDQKYFHHCSYDKINLKEDIKKAMKFNGFGKRLKTSDSINNFIKIIENK